MVLWVGPQRPFWVAVLMSESDYQPGFDDTSDLLRQVGCAFYQRGWVLGTSGNFSAVTSHQPLRVTITSSGANKGSLSARDLLQIDEEGQVLRGSGSPSAETPLHLAVIERSGAGSVLHTHSVWSTLLSKAYARDGGLFIEGYEMLKGLGGIRTHEHCEWLPILENSQDVARLSEAVTQTLTQHPNAHGSLLEGHGLYSWGANVLEAQRHTEILEFLIEVLCRMHFSGLGDRQLSDPQFSEIA